MRAIVSWLGTLSLSLMLSCGGGGGVGKPGLTGDSFCTLAGCIHGASFEEQFPLNGSEPTSLFVQTCLNGSCETVPVREQQRGSLHFSCSTQLHEICLVSVAENRLTAKLLMYVEPPPGSDPFTYLNDGDVYKISVRVPGSAPLLEINKVATYALTQPNGPGCEPVCKYAMLTPPVR